MTNIIKAPITKIRREPPFVFEEIKSSLLKRAPLPRDEDNDWAIINNFIELDALDNIDKGEDRSYLRIYGVLFINQVTGELKLFSLRYLMPELEYW